LTTAQQKRTRLPEAVAEKINLLAESRNKLIALIGTLDQLQDSIRGLEGYAGKVYWQAVNLLLPEKLGLFDAREANYDLRAIGARGISTGG